MLARLQEGLRPTLSKAVWGTLMLCVVGWLWTEEGTRQTKVDGQIRAVRENHNMDVAMGHWRESIPELLKRSGVCQLRGHYCLSDGPEGTWYWRRDGVRGPDVLDIVIPRIQSGGSPRVLLSLFMRDKAGNVAAATPQVVQVLDQLLAHFNVSPAAVAQCKAMAEPRPFDDGRLRLSCQKRLGAAYLARDGSEVVGSGWSMTIENLE